MWQAPKPGLGSGPNDGTCNNADGTTTQTSPQSQAQWLLQSIVDQNTGATPTFTYSSTGMSAWLCRTVKNGNNYPCAANGNNNYNSCPNNSSPQGQIFYENIGFGNSPAHYAVYPVDRLRQRRGRRRRERSGVLKL